EVSLVAHRIRLQEPTQLRCVITRAVVVQAGFLIEAATRVAERLASGRTTRRQVSVRIVGELLADQPRLASRGVAGTVGGRLNRALVVEAEVSLRRSRRGRAEYRGDALVDRRARDVAAQNHTAR